MKPEEYIRLMNTNSRIHGMLTVLSCMEGATITKKLSIELEDMADRIYEMQNHLYKKAVSGDEAEEAAKADL